MTIDETRVNNPTFILDKSLNVIETALDISLLNYLTIDLDYATIYIEQLLSSCKDRGNFKVLANHKPEFCDKCYFDHQDGFPRYYFDFQCLMSEVKSLILAKNLIVEDVIIHKVHLYEDISCSMKQMLEEIGDDDGKEFTTVIE